MDESKLRRGCPVNGIDDHEHFCNYRDILRYAKELEKRIEKLETTHNSSYPQRLKNEITRYHQTQN